MRECSVGATVPLDVHVKLAAEIEVPIFVVSILIPHSGAPRSAYF
jgi:hypothetical protein